VKEDFEPVLEVVDYYDGPRSGTALFQGAPHFFQSRMLDVFERKGDFESVDFFELRRVGSSPGTPYSWHAAPFA
jgi:hypothetical protein